ncbi:MAG: hypothetical protein QG604_301 [Candidatus Dependentiae bacterium]|nr:hypothetical protein [Candidatus Dependentiae bacterium]
MPPVVVDTPVINTPPAPPRTLNADGFFEYPILPAYDLTIDTLTIRDPKTVPYAPVNDVSALYQKAGNIFFMVRDGKVYKMETPTNFPSVPYLNSSPSAYHGPISSLGTLSAWRRDNGGTAVKIFPADEDLYPIPKMAHCYYRVTDHHRIPQKAWCIYYTTDPSFIFVGLKADGPLYKLQPAAAIERAGKTIYFLSISSARTPTVNGITPAQWVQANGGKDGYHCVYQEQLRDDFFVYQTAKGPLSIVKQTMAPDIAPTNEKITDDTAILYWAGPDQVTLLPRYFVKHRGTIFVGGQATDFDTTHRIILRGNETLTAAALDEALVRATAYQIYPKQPDDTATPHITTSDPDLGKFTFSNGHALRILRADDGRKPISEPWAIYLLNDDAGVADSNRFLVALKEDGPAYLTDSQTTRGDPMSFGILVSTTEAVPNNDAWWINTSRAATYSPRNYSRLYHRRTEELWASAHLPPTAASINPMTAHFTTVEIPSWGTDVPFKVWRKKQDIPLLSAANSLPPFLASKDRSYVGATALSARDTTLQLKILPGAPWLAPDLSNFEQIWPLL